MTFSLEAVQCKSKLECKSKAKKEKTRPRLCFIDESPEVDSESVVKTVIDQAKDAVLDALSKAASYFENLRKIRLGRGLAATPATEDGGNNQEAAETN